jgi:heme-degrading monooxygenase HmoA
MTDISSDRAVELAFTETYRARYEIDTYSGHVTTAALTERMPQWHDTIPTRDDSGNPKASTNGGRCGCHRPTVRKVWNIIMIVEAALITVRRGSESEFEAVFPTAITVLAGSKGYLSHELRRSVETPNRYALRVEWATLEDHTVGFRGSPAFAQWRALIGPFFDGSPVVEHFSPVAGEED